MRFAILTLAPLAALVSIPALADPTPEETTKTEIAPAVASQPEQKPAETVEKTQPKAEAEKRICRHIRTDASSRRKTKVCMTSTEWREANQGR